MGTPPKKSKHKETKHVQAWGPKPGTNQEILAPKQRGFFYGKKKQRGVLSPPLLQGKTRAEQMETLEKILALAPCIAGIILHWRGCPPAGWSASALGIGLYLIAKESLLVIH
jgi:hypothetical protein